MAKASIKVGYVLTENVGSGVWMPNRVLERVYKADVNRRSRRFNNDASVNGELTVSNELSIVADPYAFEHFHLIRYAEFRNSKWIVTNVSVEYPRLVMSLGGIYNGPTADGTASDS